MPKTLSKWQAIITEKISGTKSWKDRQKDLKKDKKHDSS